MTDKQCERCGEVNPAEIHTCSPQEPVAWFCELPDNKISIKIVGKPTEGNWKPLYTAPPQGEEGCAECGKQASEGWALYCVKCSEPVREWQTLTENEIKHLWYEACQTNLELTSQLIVHLARNIEAKLKEKNT